MLITKEAIVDLAMKTKLYARFFLAPLVALAMLYPVGATVIPNWEPGL